MKLLNQIKAYLTFLGRNKLYTSINVLGLSISLCFCILLFSFLYSEFTVDNFQENSKDIYIVGSEDGIANGHKIGEYLKVRMPEIKNTCAIYQHEDILISPEKGSDHKIRVNKAIFVDSSFLEMLSFKILSGDRNRVLHTKNGVLLSESFAVSAFGNIDVVGKSFSYTYTPYGSQNQVNVEFSVEGVIEDFHKTVFPSEEIIFTSEALSYFNPGALSENFNSCSSYILLQSIAGIDLRPKGEEVLNWFKNDYWIYKDDCFFGPKKEVRFIPLKELYFINTSGTFENDFFNEIDKNILSVFLSICIVVLIFSIFNYINLTTAQTGFRAKEMAVNRLYGASQHNIRFRMFIESELLIIIAFLIALFIAFSLESYISSLVGHKFYLKENLNFTNISILVLFMIVLGGINAIIPSYYLSKYKPIDVVKGEFKFRSKMIYSRIFIVIQICITVVLIIFSITMNRQMNHILNFDYGYNHKNIINIDIWNTEGINYKSLVSEINKIPGVKSIGFTSGTPFDRGNNNTLMVSNINKYVGFQIFKSDPATVKMLGYRFIQDNKLADKDIWWVNEESLKRCSLDPSASEIKINDYWDGENKNIKIAGIFKNIYLRPVNSYEEGFGGYEPMVLKIMDEVEDPWNILIETEVNSSDILTRISDIAENIGIPAPKIEYIDDSLKNSVIKEIRIKNIMFIFTFIALVISSLGLFAMATYFSQQASKEIAIRKICGSTSSEILIKMLSRFMILIMIAFPIACLISYFLTNKWLEGFNYRVSINLCTFLIAAGGILLISLISIFGQSYKTANTNPVNTINK